MQTAQQIEAAIEAAAVAMAARLGAGVVVELCGTNGDAGPEVMVEHTGRAWVSPESRRLLAEWMAGYSGHAAGFVPRGVRLV